MVESIPVPPFSALSPLEERMRAWLSARPDDGTRRILFVPANDAETSLSAPFLRWFVLEAIPAAKLPLMHFELRDAEIAERLDLAGTKSDILLRFVNCCFAETIDLTDAELAGFEMIAGRAVEILADRFVTKGSLAVRAADKSDAGRPQHRAEWPPTITKRIRLCGADIHGNLDFRGCIFLGESPAGEARVPLFADGLSVKGNLLLSYRFSANGEVRLNGCKVGRNLDCSGATLTNSTGYSLSAAGAHVSGSAYFCETKRWSTYRDQIPFVSHGNLRLEGARIDGDLDFTNGEFTSVAFLLEEYWAPAPDDESDEYLYAIEASGVEVGGDIQFAGAFRVRGVVDLIGAKIAGDFNCEKGVFDFPGEDALNADGISVSGTAYLDNGATTSGILRFPLSSFAQGFFVDGAIFDVSGRYRDWVRGSRTAGELKRPGSAGICGIYAPLAEVSGEFRWRRVEKRNPGNRHYPLWLHLAGAKTDAIDDQQEAWEKLDRFDVTGCDYKSILNLIPDVAWRMGELDRQYTMLDPTRKIAALYGPVALPDLFVANFVVAARALGRALLRWWPWRHYEDAELRTAMKSFSPQPYIQLARAVRAAGYEKAANDVLIHLERNRTRYSDFGLLRQLGRWTLDFVLLYGFSPFRPLLFLLVAMIISTGIFEEAYDEGLIVATRDNSGRDQWHPPSVAFNALVYAADTLVPLVDLNQKKNWVIEAAPAATVARQNWWQALVRAWGERPRSGPGLLVIFNTFLGWLMTTLFAAGVTGLVRGGGDAE